MSADPKVFLMGEEYSYELLLQYLHKTPSITMLGIINEHINFQVSPGQPGSISDDAEVVTLVGSGQDAANLINQKEIHWEVRGRGRLIYSGDSIS